MYILRQFISFLRSAIDYYYSALRGMCISENNFYY